MLGGDTGLVKSSNELANHAVHSFPHRIEPLGPFSLPVLYRDRPLLVSQLGKRAQILSRPPGR